MKKAEIVKKFRNISLEELQQEIETKGKYKVFSEFAEIMDKRTYFSVDIEGKVYRKSVNPILLKYPYESDTELLAQMILDYGDPRERQVIHPIYRLSNIETTILKEKLMKTLVHNSFDYAKRYAKELFLREKTTFFALMKVFVQLSETESFKTEVLEAFEKVMEEVVYDEALFYLYLSYLTRYRDKY